MLRGRPRATRSVPTRRLDRRSPSSPSAGVFFANDMDTNAELAVIDLVAHLYAGSSTERQALARMWCVPVDSAPPRTPRSSPLSRRPFRELTPRARASSLARFSGRFPRRQKYSADSEAERKQRGFETVRAPPDAVADVRGRPERRVSQPGRPPNGLGGVRRRVTTASAMTASDPPASRIRDRTTRWRSPSSNATRVSATSSTSSPPWRAREGPRTALSASAAKGCFSASGAAAGRPARTGEGSSRKR